MDDRLDDIGIDDGHTWPERLPCDRAEAVDRLTRREKRKVGPKDQLVRDAILDGLDERLVEQKPARHERRDVGIDMRVTPNHGNRFARPRVADVSDHDAQLREANCDLVDQHWSRVQQRTRSRERRALVDQHG